MERAVDRGTLNGHLALAERQIASDWADVERQEAMVEQLEASGHDTEAARNLLQQFVKLLAMDVADRDSILTELYGSTMH